MERKIAIKQTQTELARSLPSVSDLCKFASKREQRQARLALPSGSKLCNNARRPRPFRRCQTVSFPTRHPLPTLPGASGLAKALLFLLWLSVCAACGGDEEDRRAYPSLLTEFVELYTDAEGNGTRFVTDGGKTYAAENPLQGLKPDVAYRIVCGYEVTDGYRDGLPAARIWTAETVILLKRKEELADTDDPTAVAAVWTGRNYLNLHLLPKTQGGTQEWGYRTDSVRPSPTGTVLHLSLCHRQAGDPYSYSAAVYAGLPLLPLGLQAGDSIVFTILTFDGRRTWRFGF